MATTELKATPPVDNTINLPIGTRDKIPETSGGRMFKVDTYHASPLPVYQGQEVFPAVSVGLHSTHAGVETFTSPLTFFLTLTPEAARQLGSAMIQAAAQAEDLKAVGWDLSELQRRATKGRPTTSSTPIVVDPSSNRLTNAQQDQLLQALRKRNVSRPCSRCGNPDFSLLSFIFAMPNREAQVGREGVPYIVTVCTNCGFLSQHALGGLGFQVHFPQPPPGPPGV